MKRTLLATVLVLITSSTYADFIGIYVGAGYWNADFSGDVVSDVSVTDQLQINGDASSQLYIAFEHPVPVLPNIRVARSDVSDSGQGILTSSFTFNGVPFAVGDNEYAEIDLTHTDLTLYYEVLDTGMDLDVGITARYLRGNVTVGSVSQDADAVLPMLYGHGKFGLPFSGLYLAADVNAVALKGNSVSDIAVKLGWETENFILPEIGIELGYRRFNVDVDASDADVAVDMGVDGLFINLTGHF